MANEFSETWFDTFLSSSSAALAAREIEFIQRHLPVAQFPRLLDVPCGIGRHALPLALHGYQVLGVDRSSAAIEVASRRAGRGATFQVLDLADLEDWEADARSR